MAKEPAAPESSSNEAATSKSRQSPPNAPRWVKALGFVALGFVVLFVALHLAGIGFGPHMHHGQ
jgi:ABC-type Fe3+ transport system permease subunit